MIFADDVPEIIASLLLVAHEPSASNELKIDVNYAVDVTVNAYCGVSEYALPVFCELGAYDLELFLRRS